MVESLSDSVVKGAGQRTIGIEVPSDVLPTDFSAQHISPSATSTHFRWHPSRWNRSNDTFKLIAAHQRALGSESRNAWRRCARRNGSHVASATSCESVFTIERTLAQTTLTARALERLVSQQLDRGRWRPSRYGTTVRTWRCVSEACVRSWGHARLIMHQQHHEARYSTRARSVSAVRSAAPPDLAAPSWNLSHLNTSHLFHMCAT